MLQSEKVIQVLRAHQRRVKEEKIKEIQERKEKKEHEPPKETLDLRKCKIVFFEGPKETPPKSQAETGRGCFNLFSCFQISYSTTFPYFNCV